jgi:hypothetical protein
VQVVDEPAELGNFDHDATSGITSRQG